MVGANRRFRENHSCTGIFGLRAGYSSAEHPDAGYLRTGPNELAAASATLSSLSRTQRNASGVVEERPPPVIVDFHAPTQLGAIGDGVGKPCVRTLSAVDIPAGDDFAVRVDNPERNHAM